MTLGLRAPAALIRRVELRDGRQAAEADSLLSPEVWDRRDLAREAVGRYAIVPRWRARVEDRRS